MYELKETILQVSGLDVIIDGKPILKNINFEEKDVWLNGKQVGQVIGFLGKSGSGKSTLFKAIAGLISFDGEIKITKDNELKNVQRGNVGYVDQKYTLLRHRTIEEMLHIILKKTNKDEKSRKDIIHHLLESWDLLKCKTNYPNELSGGQKQRTAILCQLLSSHKYLIFDEPASGLDVKNILNFKKTIKRLSSLEDNNTILFSTHDIKLAVELADVIYIMENGQIISTIDLKKQGLSWVDFNEKHIELVNLIEKMICQ